MPASSISPLLYRLGTMDSSTRSQQRQLRRKYLLPSAYVKREARRERRFRQGQKLGFLCIRDSQVEGFKLTLGIVASIRLSWRSLLKDAAPIRKPVGFLENPLLHQPEAER